MSVVVFLCGLDGGSSYYATLTEAIEAAQAGDEITILADITVNSAIGITKSLSINLNGHTITNNVTSNRLFRVGNATLTINGGNGGQMIIPETNKSSYGFVDLRDVSNTSYSGSGLVANNVSFIGATAAGAFFKSRANSQSFTLTNVNVECTEGDGQIYNTFVNGANYSIVNCAGNSDCTVTIKGGTYKYATRANNAGIFQDGKNAISSYEDVTVISEHGPINQGESYSCTIKNCNFSNPNNVSANPWTNTAICAASNKTINVDGGYYEGNYALYVYDSTGTINVSSGTFVGNTNVIKADNKYSDDYHVSIINISGGNFTGGFSLQGHCILSIKGGTFDHDPSTYVADGYVAVEDDGIWTVEEAPVDYATFNAALYDAGGVWSEAVTVVLKESQRDIFNNNGAQFYLGRTSANINGTEGDITVKNVTFTYDADDSSVSLEKFGELQIPLSGTLTFENCTFIGVSVSPWSTLESSQTNYPQKAEFKNCTFRDLKNRYGVHQNKAKTLVVTGCTFDTMERGIHTNCPEPVKIEIKNNTFTGIDSTKGVLCIAEDSRGRITGDTSVDVSGNIAEGQAFLRLPNYNDIITLTQANAILEGNTYGSAYVEGGMIPTE